MKRSWSSLLKRRSGTLALAFGLAASLAAADAAANEAGDLRRLFPKRAAVESGAASGAPLWRLELPSDVLASCRPDLSDLRIFDEQDQELPFAVDPGPLPRPASLRPERVVAKVVSARRREIPRTRRAAAMFEETYELTAPPPAPEGSAWQLLLETSAPEFSRELQIQALGRGASSERIEGTVFRLRTAAAERASSPLPSAAGERLAVRLAGEEPFALHPRFFYETIERVPALQVAAVPLAATVHPSAGAEQRFELARPAGIVPSALHISTSTPAFDRRITVYDLRQGAAPVRIGAGRVFRLPLAKPPESLELELAPASGARLEVHVESGDSPPLADAAFAAVIRAPSLVFVPPAAGARRAATLYFGGGRVQPPRYDLGRLLADREPSVLRSREHAGGEREDRERSQLVRLGPITDNEAYARTPALAFAMHPGAAIDVRRYTHQRALTVAASSEGLSRIVLTAADLALLRADLGDLRVVDAADRQWPYLLDRTHGVDVVPLAPGARRWQGSASRLPLELPFAPLVPSTLVLDAREPYFDRVFRVHASSLEGQTLELARGRLTRTAPGAREPIALELAPVRVRSLELEVTDADDAPLSWTALEAHVKVPALYLLAEPGSYRLLLGNAGDAEPRYDIATARELILSVQSRDVRLERLGENPMFRASARLAAGEGPFQFLLWAALALAVAGLGALTLRLARRDGTPAP